MEGNSERDAILYPFFYDLWIQLFNNSFHIKFCFSHLNFTVELINGKD